MKYENLVDAFKNEPIYRLKQAQKAIFVQLIENWDEATTFSKPLRQLLKKDFPLAINAEISHSENGQTQKALLTLDDGSRIESVLMRHQKRNTVCISTQVGCPLGCKFCATGKMGFTRNLTDWEIILQALLFGRNLKEEGAKITNLVLMGMGEPFLNYDSTISAINLLHTQMGLGARRFSISTAGIPEGIRKLAEQPLEINLALSLHAPNDELRSKLMPINDRYSLTEVIAAVNDYLAKTRRKVMFEYLMIDGVNDQPEHAQQLIRIARGKLVNINLIPYNPTGPFKPSSKTQLVKFRNLLEKAGLSVTQRFEFGQKINAACGQLAIDKSN